MLKKIVTFILVNFLWPILREILTDVLKQLLKAAISGIKALMRKWEKDEIDKTEDAAERVDIEKKYHARQADLDALEEKLVNASDKIVQDALVRSEPLRTELLSLNSTTLHKLEAPAADPNVAT